jgi:voltage-gated potassium channel Kch
MPAVLGSALIAVVTLSMAATPLVVALRPLLLRGAPKPSIDEEAREHDAPVVLIGFGRFGQILSRVIAADGLETTIIDRNPWRIRTAARLGMPIHYGDATRLDVLRAAGVGRAKLVAITTEEPEVTTRIVELVKAEFPLARVFARSYDRTHALALIEKNVDYQIRETYESALAFGRQALRALDLDDQRIETVVDEVRRRDADQLIVRRPDAVAAPEPATTTGTKKPPRRRQIRELTEAIDPAAAKTATAAIAAQRRPRPDGRRASHFGNTGGISTERDSPGLDQGEQRIPSAGGRASLRIATCSQGESP